MVQGKGIIFWLDITGAQELYPHPHLVCTECKKIMDPSLSALADVTQELTQETGFRITNHRLDFFGICPECQKKE